MSAFEFTYRNSLELVDDETKRHVFTFRAVHRSIEKIVAGGFKPEPPELQALVSAAENVRRSVNREVARLERVLDLSPNVISFSLLNLFLGAEVCRALSIKKPV